MEKEKRAEELAARSRYDNEMEDGFREVVEWALQKLEMDFQIRFLGGKRSCLVQHVCELTSEKAK